MSQVRSPLGGQRHGRMGKSGYKQSWRRALSARQSERVNEDQDGYGTRDECDRHVPRRVGEVNGCW